MAEEEKDVRSQTSEVQDEGGGDALTAKRSVEVKAFHKQGRCAGLDGVAGVPGIENRDVSDVIKAHMEYHEAIPILLQKVFHSW